MNYVGHALVASEVFPNATDAQIYGSMAPDFIGMSGTRRIRDIEDRDLAEGVKLHLDTDRAIDRNSLFTDITAQFLAPHEEFLSHGAARACANAGTEMLLDGFILQKSQAVEAYARAIKGASEGNIPIDQLTTDPAKFAAFNERHSRLGIPYVYQDPLFVASALQRRISTRKSSLLKFDEELVPEVARVFRLQQAAIGDVSNELIEQIINGLPNDSENDYDNGPIAPIIPGLAVTVNRIDGADKKFLTPFELSSMGDSISASTASGRQAARMALGQVGFAGQAEVPRGVRGEPVFPERFSGSISHSGSWVIALASRRSSFLSVGVDIESSNRRFKRDIGNRIATGDELSAFSDFGESTTLAIASIKESAYKALYGYVNRVIGFKDITLERTAKDKVSIRAVDPELADATHDLSVKAVMLNGSKWFTAVCYVR